MKLKIGDEIKILKFREGVLTHYPKYRKIQGKILKIGFIHHSDCFEVYYENDSFLIKNNEYEIVNRKPLTYKEFMKKCVK